MMSCSHTSHSYTRATGSLRGKTVSDPFKEILKIIKIFFKTAATNMYFLLITVVFGRF